MSKVSMMFKIISLLQTRYIASAGELASILETSPRNIKAYIESLRMAGVPTVDKCNFSDSRGKTDITQKVKSFLYSDQKAIFKRNRIRIVCNNPIKKQLTVRKLDPYNTLHLYGYRKSCGCQRRKLLRLRMTPRLKIWILGGY